MLNPFKRTRDPEEELKALLGNYELPTFSAVAHRVLQELRNPEHTSASVAKLLSTDPGLSTSLLKTVNSAAFGLRNSIDSIPQAVAVMGSSALESLAVSVAVGNSLPRNSTPEFEFRRFWLASARRATTARALAGRLHPATAVQSYTAALLQDMAIPFLAHCKPEQYGPLLRHWHASADNLAELEQSELGWSHPQVAGWIAEHWGLPESLTAAIAAHHDTDAPPEDCPPAVTLVSCLVENDDEPGTEQLIETVHARYAIPTDEIDALIRTSFDDADALAQLLD